jgi:hypothetical protein
VRAFPGFQDMSIVNDQRAYLALRTKISLSPRLTRMYCSPSPSHPSSSLCSIAIHSNLLLQKGTLPDKCNCHPLRRKKGKGPLGALAFPHSAHLASTGLRRQRVALDPNPPGRYRYLHRRTGKFGIGTITGARQSLFSRDRRRGGDQPEHRHGRRSRA